MKWLLLLLLLFVLIVPTIAHAQETTPAPTPAPAFTAETQLDEMLLWLLYAASTVWAWAVVVEGGIEIVKARVLAYLPAEFKEAQKVVIVVGVILLAYVTMKQGGYSVFDNAPFSINQTLADVATALILAVTAFGRHDKTQAGKTIEALSAGIVKLAKQVKATVD